VIWKLLPLITLVVNAATLAVLMYGLLTGAL